MKDGKASKRITLDLNEGIGLYAFTPSKLRKTNELLNAQILSTISTSKLSVWYGGVPHYPIC